MNVSIVPVLRVKTPDRQLRRPYSTLAASLVAQLYWRRALGNAAAAGTDEYMRDDPFGRAQRGAIPCHLDGTLRTDRSA